MFVVVQRIHVWQGCLSFQEPSNFFCIACFGVKYNLGVCVLSDHLSYVVLFFWASSGQHTNFFFYYRFLLFIFYFYIHFWCFVENLDKRQGQAKELGARDTNQWDLKLPLPTMQHNQDYMLLLVVWTPSKGGHGYTYLIFSSSLSHKIQCVPQTLSNFASSKSFATLVFQQSLRTYRPWGVN